MILVSAIPEKPHYNNNNNNNSNNNNNNNNNYKENLQYAFAGVHG